MSPVTMQKEALSRATVSTLDELVGCYDASIAENRHSLVVVFKRR